MDDIYSDHYFEESPERSPEFWEALVALGGTPEQVAPHLGLTEREVAERMAAARGRLGELPETPYPLDAPDPLEKSLGVSLGGYLNRPSCLTSNWGRGRVR